MRFRPLVAAAPLLASCLLGPAFDDTPRTFDTKPFAPIGDPPPPPPDFGPRSGPRAPWNDVATSVAAPGTGHGGGTLPDLATEPDLVIGDLAVYTTTDGTALVAWDLAKNEQKWRAEADLAAGTLATDGTRVCGASPAHFQCLDLATGESRFRLGPDPDLPGPVGGRTELAFRDGIVYGIGENAAWALDADTGDVKWKHPVAPSARTLTLLGDTVLLASPRCEPSGAPCVLALDRTTGEPLATRDTPATAALVLLTRDEAFFHVPRTANEAAQVVRWSEAGRAFGNGTAPLAALLAKSPAGPLTSLTSPGDDGDFLVAAGPVGAPTALCLWNFGSQTVRWCHDVPPADTVRAHPDAIFLRAAGRPGQVLDRATGTPSAATFALWYGRWGFDGPRWVPAP